MAFQYLYKGHIILKLPDKCFEISHNISICSSGELKSFGSPAVEVV